MVDLLMKINKPILNDEFDEFDKLAEQHIIINGLLLDELTYGIMWLIPLDINSMIFSGGLLFDAYWNKYYNGNSNYNNFKFKDIDLFLFGSEDKKKSNIVCVINNIIEKFGVDNVWAGYSDTIINITIKGIPRSVQIICTNRNTADEVINDFDLAHVMMYLSDVGLYVSPFALASMESKVILPNPKSKAIAKFSRLKKYHQRGLSMSKYISEYPLVNLDFKKIYDNEKIVQIYSRTNNFLKNIQSHLANYNKLFNRNNFNIKKVKSTKILNLSYINITGNLNKYSDKYSNNYREYGDYSYYLNEPELFLFENMEIVDAKIRNNDYYYDFDFKKLVKKNYYNENKSNINKYWFHLLEASIVYYQYNRYWKDSCTRCDHFDGPHFMVISIENPQVISTIKTNIKLLLKSIKSNKERATTCLFDSLAIDPEEKKLFNLNEQEDSKKYKLLKNYGICIDNKINFKNSKALYLTICPNREDYKEYIYQYVSDYGDSLYNDGVYINSQTLNKLSDEEFKPGQKIFLSCKFISIQQSVKCELNGETNTPHIKITGFIF